METHLLTSLDNNSYSTFEVRLCQIHRKQVSEQTLSVKSTDIRVFVLKNIGRRPHLVFSLRELEITTPYCIQEATLSELQYNISVQREINGIEYVVYPIFEDDGMRNSRS